MKIANGALKTQLVSQNSQILHAHAKKVFSTIIFILFFLIDYLTIGQCNSFPGCQICESTLSCEEKGFVGNTPSNKKTCHKCSDVPLEACSSYIGCKVCRGNCINSYESCLLCLARTKVCFSFQFFLYL